MTDFSTADFTLADGTRVVVVTESDCVWATYADDWLDAIARHNIHGSSGAYTAACRSCRMLDMYEAHALLSILESAYGELPDWNWPPHSTESQAVADRLEEMSA